MSNPLTRAFFIGRATAEAIIEQLEDTLTDALSAFGKFDAEQREKLRTFTEIVIEKADQAVGETVTKPPTQDVDLQEVIDKLRAEVANLRAELQEYRNSQN
jgi:polyhydroxyalkanoate synthesis regulator phasin